ncbi:DUF2946 domain-containing protein [Pseudomonas neustonica]|jgi:hypothetical protein|uniref:DUF2946 domain-containing protein n=1 Tax=Pseudomonas neustonica TaxID=2487346 RepID=A0ABX9XMX6_9PSED|nr:MULTISPECIES: DUF2946 domain-containing protein [Pseudomonas]ROZ84542.1 DUF2946 domain-containing protein [Pseudomonas sp. SSM44]ROZ86345.1 DUF2946 domain-containing protein [Pseudomonas neustonica]|tara:strand:+ start:5338 stop:5718 length:381 start_codon:yes stop_codon:yes gene_type:complete
MILTPSQRSLFAWLLYFSILFNVPTCGLLHGQTAGMQLSGVGIVFCSLGYGSSVDLSADDGSSATNLMAFKCPVCGSITLSIALLFALAWLLTIRRDQPPALRRLVPRGYPRYAWPPANPRASPLF